MLQVELDASWINSTLKKASRCRDAAKRKAIRTKKPLDWANYRKLWNRINDKVKTTILAIPESHLSEDISDDEIAIIGYKTARRDRD